MEELQTAGNLVATVVMMTTTLVWPPTGAGAFWILFGLYAVVSILFDDETPRGTPGINYLRRS